MMIFPEVYFEKVWDIPPEFLLSRGIKGLCLDIDNTLTYDCDPELPDLSREWLDVIAKHGIRAVILSNNSESRVQPFAEICGLSYIFKAGKPSKKSFSDVCKILELKPSEIALAGDQLFTDIVCANRCGFLPLLCGRLGKDVQPFVKLKRLPEAPFMTYIKRTRSYKHE